MASTDYEIWLKNIINSASAHLGLLMELERGEGIVTEVAERMGKQKPQISMWAKRLEKAGLVEKQQDEGPRKILRLSQRGRDLLRFFRSIGPRSGPPAPPNRELVVHYLKALDAGLDMETRKRLAEALADLAWETEVEAIPEVRGLFEKLAERSIEEPLPRDIERSLWKALRHAMPRMAAHPERVRWVMAALYKPLVDRARSPQLEDDLRAESLGLLRRIFLEEPTRRQKILEVAQGLCFEKGPASGLHRETREILQQAGLMGEAKSVELLGWVLEKAKSADSDVKQRAQELLPPLIQVLSPKKGPLGG